MSGGISVELLADHPALLREAGLLRWTEWGYDDLTPDAWVATSSAAARRGSSGWWSAATPGIAVSVAR